MENRQETISKPSPRELAFALKLYRALNSEDQKSLSELADKLLHSQEVVFDSPETIGKRSK